MYCEHCGKKIDNDSIFCEHCGKKVEEKTKKISEKPSTENKILLAILIFIMFGFLFIWELKYFNSPGNAINNYLKKWSNKDYTAILEDLKIENTKFTNDKILASVLKENEEFNIEDFQLSSCEYQNSKKRAICHVSIENSKSGLTKEKSYYLERDEKNRLGIFASWKVSENNIKIIDNWRLYIPKKATATLMGEEIKEYQLSESEKSGYDCYEIPNLIQGKYQLNIKMENGMTLDKEVNINKKEYTYQFSIQDLSNEFQTKIINMGTSVIETIYNGSIQKQKLEDLKSNYDFSKIKKEYENLSKEITNTSLVEFKVSEMKMSDIAMNENGNITITFQMNYTYRLEYQENGKETTHNGESADTFYITMKNIDLKEIEKIDSLVTYFSKKY